MKLTIRERITLLNSLPKEGSFDTLKQLRVLRESLSIDDKESKIVNLRVEVLGNNMVNYKWDEDKDPQKEVLVGEKMNDLVVKTLKDLNNSNKLTEDHFSLYEKFIENSK